MGAKTRYLAATLALCMAWGQAVASPWGERMGGRRFQSQAVDMEAMREQQGPAILNPDVRVIHDVTYGADALQSFDVYLPTAKVFKAPVIVMVHGGGWSRGDKAAKGVVENKANRWVGNGAIFVSVNYRLVPQVTPVQQAQDVAQALAAVQRKAAGWGGDGSRVVLMGHSAGAHLVALLSAAPSIAYREGAKPWLGTVALDSAAYDITRIMEGPRRLRFYDAAFGNDPDLWRQVSPLQRLERSGPAFLAVCSAIRPDQPCGQARNFIDRASMLGVDARLLEMDLKHGEINSNLGLDNEYTDRVEAFLADLGVRLGTLQ